MSALPMSILIGSSPRVRGTGITRAFKQDLHWFIPACAGNRLDIIAAKSIEPVHPRVCGEQSTPRRNP